MKEPSNRAFLALALPNILTNLTVPAAGLVDMALLGHLQDVTPLAGVALGTLIFDYIYWSFAFFRMGTTGLAAKSFGAGDDEESSAIFFRAFLPAMVLGTLIFFLRQPLADLGFGLMGGELQVEAQGRAYFTARITGAPAVLGYYAIAGWLLGRHHSRSVLVMALVLNGLNVVLDYLFIFKLGWGAKGAGTATMIAEWVALLIGIWMIARVWGGLPGFQRKKVQSFAGFWEMFQLNTFILIRTFCLITTFAIFTNLSAIFGTIALAANTILLRLLNTAAYFIDGFAFALESFAGKYRGARQPAGIRRSLKLALGWNLGAVFLFQLLFLTGGRQILGALTSHQDIIAFCLDYLPLVAGVLLLSGFAYIFDGFFIGLAAGPLMGISMFVSTLTGFLPLAYAAYRTQSVLMLWYAMAFFMLMRALTLAVRVPKYLR